MGACVKRFTPAAWFACVVGCAALWQQAAAEDIVLRGAATYPERVVIPQNAVFEAVIEDISNIDGPAVQVGTTRIVMPGQPPIDFKIRYDAAKIRANGRYLVRAQIKLGERVLYSAQNLNVQNLGQPGQIELVLQRPSSGAPTATPAAAVVRPAPAPVVEAPVAPKPAPPSVLGVLPATYTGVFPCTDCLEVRYHLNVYAGGAYELRTTYVGKPKDRIDFSGRWNVGGGGRMLDLKERSGMGEQLSIVDANTLRKLDLGPKALPTGFTDELKREASFRPLDPPPAR